MDLFLTNMLIDGLEWYGLLVDYCDAFIRCLDSHSDGTHSLQSEDPSVSKWYAKFLQSVLMRIKLIYKMDGLRVSTFSANFYFGWTIPLIWLHLPLLAEMVTTKLSIFLTKHSATDKLDMLREKHCCLCVSAKHSGACSPITLEQHDAETLIISHSHNSAKQKISVWMVTPVILMLPTAMAFCLTFQGRGKQITRLRKRCLILVLS